MKQVSLYSTTVYRGALGLGAVLLCGLLLIAWTSDTGEVGLDWKFKLQLTAAALILGGGLIGWAIRVQAHE